MVGERWPGSPALLDGGGVAWLPDRSVRSRRSSGTTKRAMPDHTKKIQLSSPHLSEMFTCPYRGVFQCLLFSPFPVAIGIISYWVELF